MAKKVFQIGNLNFELRKPIKNGRLRKIQDATKRIFTFILSFLMSLFEDVKFLLGKKKKQKNKKVTKNVSQKVSL